MAFKPWKTRMMAWPENEKSLTAVSTQYRQWRDRHADIRTDGYHTSRSRVSTWRARKIKLIDGFLWNFRNGYLFGTASNWLAFWEFSESQTATLCRENTYFISTPPWYRHVLLCYDCIDGATKRLLGKVLRSIRVL